MERLPVGLIGRTGTGTVDIKFSSSDPGRVVLSDDPVKPGQGSITVPFPFNTGGIFVQSLSDTGSVDITATAGGFPAATIRVTMTPSGLAWTAPAVTLPHDDRFGPSVTGYALDPNNLSATIRQTLRPGLSGTLTLQNSNPSAVILESDTLPLISSVFDTLAPGLRVKLTVAAGGRSEIAIVQPAGFVQPAGRGPLHVEARRNLPISPLIIGRNLQAQISPPLFAGVSEGPPITFTSSNPAQLVLTSDRFTLGGPSATSTFRDGNYTAVYAQAIDGPSDVKVTASSPGYTDTSVLFNIVPTYLSFANGSGVPGDSIFSIRSQQGPVSLSLIALPEGAIGLPSQLIRPGVDSVPVAIESSNPAAAAVLKPPIINSLTNSAPFSVTPLAPGQTELTAVIPPGFVRPPPGQGRTARFTVDPPAAVEPNSFTIRAFTLGKDLQASVNLELANRPFTVDADVDVTLASSDPSKLVLSADGAQAGTGRLIVHIRRGEGFKTIFVQALDSAGDVSITVNATGYRSTATKVSLSPVAFATLSTSALSLRSPTDTLRIRPVPASAPVVNSVIDLMFRPGFNGVEMKVSSSNSAVLTVQPAQILWQAGAKEFNVNLQAVAAGTATLNFSVPPPFFAPAAVRVQVNAATFDVFLGSTIGKDLQKRFALSTVNAGTKVTVTSSDPSRVLISSSPLSPGQASLDLTLQPLVFYVQALADTGTANVTVSATGYANAEGLITLSRTAVVLRAAAPLPQNLTPLSGPIPFQAELLAAPVNGIPASPNYSLRGGAPALQVLATLSDSSVGTLTPAQLTFNPGDDTRNFTFQAAAPGTALLSLSVPSGLADPLSFRQQLLTVIPARVSIDGNLSVGKDLVKSVQVSLPPGSSRGVAVTLASADPTRLLLRGDSTTGAGPTVALTLAPGQPVQFGLIGLDSSGPATIQVSGVGLVTTNYAVTLQPSGFAFTSPISSASVGSLLSLSISPYALNPITLAPDGGFPLRPGISGVTVSVASSDSSIVGHPPAVTFNAGNNNLSAFAAASSAGIATLTIQQPAGFTAPASGASLTISIR